MFDLVSFAFSFFSRETNVTKYPRRKPYCRDPVYRSIYTVVPRELSSEIYILYSWNPIYRTAGLKSRAQQHGESTVITSYGKTSYGTKHPYDVLSQRARCPLGCFVPWDLLSSNFFRRKFCPVDVISRGTFVVRRFVIGRFVVGRFFVGHFVMGRFIRGPFVCVPKMRLHVHWSVIWMIYEFKDCANKNISNFKCNLVVLCWLFL